MVDRFTDQVQLQPISTSTGAAQGISSLADRLEGFKQSVSTIQTTLGVRRGEAEAATVPLETRTVDGKTVTIQPKKRKAGIADILLFNGAQTQSFNLTLRNGYLASLSNDNREAISGIMAQNPDDVTGFNSAVEGYAKGVLGGVDPSVRTAVAAQLDNLTTDARIRIQAASQAKFAEEARAAVDAQLSATADAGLRAARENNQIAAAEASVEYAAVVANMVLSGAITQAAAGVMIDNNNKSIAAENIVSAIRREADTDGGAGRAAQAILDFIASSPSGFSVQEQEAITDTMISELNESLNLRTKTETDQQERITATQANNSANLYIGALDGVVSASVVTLALANREINQSQAAQLISVINTRGSAVDDFVLINQITESIRNGVDEDVIRETIIENSGSRLTTPRAISLTAALNDSLDRESPLQTNNAKRAESFIVQSMRVTGPFGALDSQAEQRLATAKRDFSNAVLAGEDPWVVADGLVDRDAFTRAPNPIFGSKNDLGESMRLLNEAFDAGSITEVDYNFQFNQLQSLMGLKSTIDAFETEAARAR